jgi:conjugative transfer region lipoprotein (TIGR03751 family)
MRPPLQAIRAIVSISLLLPLLISGGCAGTKEAVLPQDGPPMQAIYDAHLREMGARDPMAVRGALGTRPIHSGDEDLEGFARDSFTELDITFPRLPNPSLVLYVFPHLAGSERTPVPGYTTTFPLYERVEYALPGEVATPR